MSTDYSPDESAVLGAPWGTVELSHRDVSLQAPLNFVTQPGVSLSAACFGGGVYDSEAAEKCISNLIGVGYRKLHIDVYWSPELSQWSLCPVALPLDIISGTETPTTEVSSAPHATLTTGRLTAVDPSDTSTTSSSSETTSPNSDGNDENFRRQETATAVHLSPETPGPTHPTAAPGIPRTVNSAGMTLYNVGPYSCSSTLDLSTLIRVLSSYFNATGDTLEAHLIYLIVNVHAGASSDAPDQPAPAPSQDQLPTDSDSIASMFDMAFGTYVYAPQQLKADRNNIGVWRNVDPKYRVAPEYFSTESTGKGQSSPDGWPSEGVVEMQRAKRILIGWGSIDPQMKAYNLSKDGGVIFDKGVAPSYVNVSSSNGGIESGCLYDPKASKPGDMNASWAMAELPDSSSQAELSKLSREFASCGISPIVNSTLSNTTADADIEPYRNISLSSVWSWYTREYSVALGLDGRSSLFCAVMDLSLSGQWRAAECNDLRYAACRIGDSPYTWTFSSHRVTFAQATSACPSGSSFAAPRTGLENTYLYSYLIDQPKDTLDNSSDVPDKRDVWVNLNSFDVPTCWVTAGLFAQCPYNTTESDVEERRIIVPTIAAVVVLIVAALTVFVKCTANRRNSRRRRVVEGWEYEGVPS